MTRNATNLENMFLGSVICTWGRCLLLIRINPWGWLTLRVLLKLWFTCAD